MSKLFIFTLVILLAGCAGNYNKIYIATSGGESATCRVRNQAGKWQVNAPGALTVKKSVTDLRISCTNQQDRLGGSKRVKADKAGDYPEEIVIKLAKRETGQKNDEDEDESDLTPLNKLPEAPPEANKKP